MSRTVTGDVPAPVMGVPVLAGSKHAVLRITVSISPNLGSVGLGVRSLIPSCRNPTIGKGPPGIAGRLKRGTVTTESLRDMLLTPCKAAFGLFEPPVIVT